MTVPSTGRLLLEQRCRTREGTPQWGIRTSRLLSGHAHLQHRGPRRDGTSRTSREGQRKNEPAPPGRPQSDTDAKKIEARRRISLSSRSRLTSDFRRLISADSSVVTPGRVPSSTSAWASQRRTDSRETPSWRATAAVAAVRVGYSWACSRTSRTHLARSWGSIFHGCLSILSDSNSSGIKPGPIHYRLGEFLRSFWVNPLRHQDYGWAWFSRLFMNWGYATGMSYQVLFLTDGL